MRVSERLGRIAVLVVGIAAPTAASADGAIQWRADYNTSRGEAREKSRPIFLEFSTEECFYCRKLEATTFRDPVIVEMLNQHFVPLHVDADATPTLTQALRVKVYPTIVIANSEGKILSLIEGYMDVDRLKGHLQRAMATSAPDWMARDFQEATRSLETGDYPRAISLFAGVIKDGKDRPVQEKAKRALYDIEQQAAVQLARAKDLHDRGQSLEAADTLTKVLKTYTGTRAADDAAGMLASVGGRPEMRDLQRSVRARELLAQAREEYRSGEYMRCLDHCKILSTTYGDTGEGAEGGQLASRIETDPDMMARVVSRLDEQMAAMQVTLAEAWLKKGRPAEAKLALQRVVDMCPKSDAAEVAQAKLKQIENGTAMRSVDFEKR